MHLLLQAMWKLSYLNFSFEPDYLCLWPQQKDSGNLCHFGVFEKLIVCFCNGSGQRWNPKCVHAYQLVLKDTQFLCTYCVMSSAFTGNYRVWKCLGLLLLSASLPWALSTPPASIKVAVQQAVHSWWWWGAELCASSCWPFWLEPTHNRKYSTTGLQHL